MNYKKMTWTLMQVVVIPLLMSQSVIAEDIRVIGSIKHTIILPNTDSSSQQGVHKNKHDEKVIQLLRIQLSDEAKARLVSRSKDALAHTHQFSYTQPNSENSLIPNKAQLEMNKVPVLDQGIHGTCVTFAVTGALDASIGKGDYVSQLCNLQLGTYLEKHGYGYSGWDGSFSSTVINQIDQFGIVNMDNQQTTGCGGLTKYPTYYSHDPESFIEPEQYRSMSEMVFGKVVNWTDVYQKDDPVKTLDDVKQSLHSGDRLVFGVMIPHADLGFVGAVGKYKTWIFKDTWVLTPEILEGIEHIESGHEMIITGYDDDAVAVDNNGNKHKGLLKLRNSWGKLVGDYGEFYMSYDYFKLLASEVTRFSPPSI